MNLSDTGRIVLNGTEVFAGLPDEVLAAVRSYMDLRIVPQGTVLFSESDEGDRLYIIRSGSVRIAKEQDGRSVVLARRGRGDIIGEMALIDSSPRFASAVCETECELFILSRSNFFAVLAAHPHIAERILRVMTARVREADVKRLHELEAKNRDLEAARARLEASLTYRDRVLAVSPYPIIVTDAASRVQLVNSAAERLFGPTTHAQLWSWVVPRDPSIPMQADRAVGNNTTWRAEMEVEGPDAHVLLCAVTGVPIADTGEGQSARLWIFEDLTEIRALQLQSVEQERLATKGEMAAEIAHELNNYLAVLWGNAELLPMHLGETRPPGVDKALENIRQALTQVGIFTDNLLRSRHPLGQRTEVDFNEFLRSQITFLRPQKRFKKIVIKTQWDESVPPLLCDPSGLQQVFYNLLLNAADALAGAGTEHHTVFVTTQYARDEGAVRLIVGDDGPGIPAELMTQLFANRVTSKPDGHGFGLLILARILREHGGTITPGKREGGGAEFVVTLPLGNQPAA